MHNNVVYTGKPSSSTSGFHYISPPKLNMSSITEKDSTNTTNTIDTSNTTSTDLISKYAPIMIGGVVALFFFLKKR